LVADTEKFERLAKLLSNLQELTRTGALHWERQAGSAHRYARWNNNLLILGPADTDVDSERPRYLFITPFNSPACIEVNSNDERLGSAVLNLSSLVEEASSHEPATDPFALSGDILDRLES